MPSRNVVDLRGRAGARAPGPQLPFGAPKKRAPLKHRRRRVRALIAFLILIVIAALVWGVSALSYLPRLAIEKVEVVGASSTPAALIADYVGTKLYDGSHPFLSPDNIFLYHPDQLSRDVVERFPRVKSAQVSRPSLLSQTIIVTVQERQPYALWCQGAGNASSSSCYFMDDTGFMFAPSPSEASSTPRLATPYVFFGGVSASSTNLVGQSFASAHLPGIISLLTFLGQAGFSPKGVSIQSDQDFYVPMNEGFFIKASFGQDAETLTRNLVLVLSSDPLKGNESKLEYVDLRFGDRVYYKFQGAAEVQASP